VRPRKDDGGKQTPQVVEALGEFVSEWRSLGNTIIMRPSVASFALMMVRSPLSSLEDQTRFECLTRTAAPLNSRSREIVSRQSCRLVSVGRLLKKLSFQPIIETGPGGPIIHPLICEALNTDEELVSTLKKARLESVSVTGYEGPLTEMSLSLSADAERRTQRPSEPPTVTWLVSASKKILPGTGFRGQVRAVYLALDSLSYRLQDLTKQAFSWESE